MELKDRIGAIIRENRLKQKEFAAIIGVTESYVSTLLSGRNRNISASLASLIEEKLGYSVRWLQEGKEPKFKQVGSSSDLSDIHKKAILMLERMSEEQIKAVLAFIYSLEKIERESQQNP